VRTAKVRATAAQLRPETTMTNMNSNQAARPSVRAAVRAFGDAWFIAFDDGNTCQPIVDQLRDEHVIQKHHQQREREQAERQYRQRVQARAQKALQREATPCR